MLSSLKGQNVRGFNRRVHRASNPNIGHTLINRICRAARERRAPCSCIVDSIPTRRAIPQLQKMTENPCASNAPVPTRASTKPPDPRPQALSLTSLAPFWTAATRAAGFAPTISSATSPLWKNLNVGMARMPSSWATSVLASTSTW